MDIRTYLAERRKGVSPPKVNPGDISGNYAERLRKMAKDWEKGAETQVKPFLAKLTKTKRSKLEKRIKRATSKAREAADEFEQLSSEMKRAFGD